MAGKTFAEKILGGKKGDIVFREPDLVLTHDNTASIRKTFQKMGGSTIPNPDRLLVVLDHNAPPTNAKLANDYEAVREFVTTHGITKFYDAGHGICHEIMSYHARPGMIITGSDSHTCTAGAFNTLATGIDRTEAAATWKTRETWFRIPESIKIVLNGQLSKGVYAKDLSLWIIGLLGSAGANYKSIEYHGEGVESLTLPQRMTVANLASEMGAKNAVFPADNVLREYLGENDFISVWADHDAEYEAVFEINLDEIFPVVAVPHQVDNVKAVDEIAGIPVHQGLIGTCTNGRLEDLRVAAKILAGKQVSPGFQLLVIPASRKIYLQAIEEGLIAEFVKAGANVLSSSCGPCLGTGQGIPFDNANVISTANRNFPGRMGNKNAFVYLASPATVALSAVEGKIVNPFKSDGKQVFPFKLPKTSVVSLSENESRRFGNVWDYSDIDNLDTDRMFSGKHTYNILSSDGEAIVPHLFEDFDPNFAASVQEGDIIIAGENFGCGSSREHPAVGMAHAGIKAIIVKSVNRIFYRSSVNQGLVLIVSPDAVDTYKTGDSVEVDFEKGTIMVGNRRIRIAPLPGKLKSIITSKGLINYLSG